MKKYLVVIFIFIIVIISSCSAADSYPAEDSVDGMSFDYFVTYEIDGTNYEVYLPICSGFILPGGSDINPYYYNEINEGKSNINFIDDIIDFKILDYATTNKIPLLGICRGHQVINVYFGGSLYQDISNHQEAHFITYKNRKYYVNSTHHQAIKNIGYNLTPIFVSNNIIESFTHKSFPIIGVQWHPERMNDLSSSFIFKYFKSGCRNTIKRKRLVEPML